MANDYTFFNGLQTANATSEAKEFKYASGAAQLSAMGTFDSATVTLQASTDGGTTYKDTAIVLDGSSPPFAEFKEAYGNKLRVVVAGGGGSLSLRIKMQEFKQV